MMNKELRVCRVKPEIEKKFNVEYDERMSRTIFGGKDCRETYNTDKGWDTIAFPGRISKYWRATRKVNCSKFEFSE